MSEPDYQSNRPIVSGSESGDDPPTALTRDELLAEVLGETISRQRDDPDRLVEAIRDWKRSLPRSSVDAEVELDPLRFAELVGLVLTHRLGDRARKLPGKLRSEVGEALWNDPASRKRIEQLWASLGDSP